MGNYIYTISHVSQGEKRVYGWIKDKKDDRDQYHNFEIYKHQDNIKEVNLIKNFPPVYNQGELGSCTANAIAGAYEYDEIIQKEKNIFTPSRLFIYYNERAMEGTINKDSGASLRDGMKSVNKVGVCPEYMWPYDISKFTDKPSASCYQYAKDHHTIKYKRVQQDLNQIKQCLIEGFPFVFGFVVYESFESPQVAKTGIMPMPKPGEKILGGHAVCAVGFSDEKQMVLVRNSWGPDWGCFNGYFWMPYEFIKNPDYCSDFWTVRKVFDK